jgi:peptidoglycan hydrolase-like protein with peptidoglycan-binding domain
MRKLILASVSVLALGIGGTAMSVAANMNNPGTSATEHNMPSMSDSSQGAASGALTQSEVRQAQQKLQEQGFYKGTIDGLVGPETQRAVAQFQRQNGLDVTVTLDEPTMDKLLGNAGMGQGSTLPPQGYGQTTTAPANPRSAPPGSNLGNGATPSR